MNLRLILIVSLLSILLIPTLLSAQDKKGTYNDKQNLKVVLDKEPEYKGGEAALYKYINDSLLFTEEEITNKLSGEVMISFDVMPDSSLTNIGIVSGVSTGVDQQILQLFKKLKFGPSIQNGIALKMNVILSIPVRYRPNQKSTN